MEKLRNEGWSSASHEVFWGELAPYDHVVQIYEDEETFLELLKGFVNNGISTGDSTIVIATRSHLDGLGMLLEKSGHSLPDLIRKKQYVPVDAEETLAKFMVNDWPDENLFGNVVAELISIAKADGKRVRAFGEMVALLWAKGQVGATVRLEQLWNRFCENEAFCLFCAYPERGFTQDASESIMHICGAHAKIINGSHHDGRQIFYKSSRQEVG
ncbi:MAG TPA: MEDS domain-containing protein [Cyclobacteriaceae bacterium]|nr:MEDS domain-containing protein [Cyclobacteriaceae bacterium]